MRLMGLNSPSQGHHMAIASAVQTPSLPQAVPIATFEPRLLADQIERTANHIFDGDKLGVLSFRTHRWTEVTRVIKQTMGDLGKKLGYQVAASGFPKFRSSLGSTI